MGENERGFRTHLVDLPLCSLHVMESGDGPPLIIVPATISELENWADLVRFIGQWFRAYFFELPGHGQSTALPADFTRTSSPSQSPNWQITSAPSDST